MEIGGVSIFVMPRYRLLDFLGEDGMGIWFKRQRQARQT